MTSRFACLNVNSAARQLPNRRIAPHRMVAVRKPLQAILVVGESKPDTTAASR